MINDQERLKLIIDNKLINDNQREDVLRNVNPDHVDAPIPQDAVLDSYSVMYNKFQDSLTLLYACEHLLRNASIYVEDKHLLDEIDAHLERVEQFHKLMIEEHKKSNDNEKKIL